MRDQGVTAANGGMPDSAGWPDAANMAAYYETP
jgi:hypothetical protein